MKAKKKSFLWKGKCVEVLCVQWKRQSGKRSTLVLLLLFILLFFGGASGRSSIAFSALLKLCVTKINMQKYIWWSIPRSLSHQCLERWSPRGGTCWKKGKRRDVCFPCSRCPVAAIWRVILVVHTTTAHWGLRSFAVITALLCGTPGMHFVEIHSHPNLIQVPCLVCGVIILLQTHPNMLVYASFTSFCSEERLAFLHGGRMRGDISQSRFWTTLLPSHKSTWNWAFAQAHQQGKVYYLIKRSALESPSRKTLLEVWVGAKEKGQGRIFEFLNWRQPHVGSGCWCVPMLFHISFP